MQQMMQKEKNTKIEINLPKELTLQQITNDQDEDITSQITNKNNKLTIDLGNIADTEVRGFILTFTTEIKRQRCYNQRNIFNSNSESRWNSRRFKYS